MGMTMQQIERYFLKVGNSYYNSDEFKLSKMKYAEKGAGDFTPVSQFGIGILSCFMVSEQVEVSTRAIENGTYPIRLSLSGLHSHYYLFTKDDLPPAFPKEHQDEKGYRKGFGTSIALKIKPDFDREEFDLDGVLTELLFCAPVSIHYRGNFYGDQKVDDFIEETKIVKFNKKQLTELEEFLSVEKYQYSSISPHIKIESIRLNHDTLSNIDGILYNLNVVDNLMRWGDIHQDRLRWKFDISSFTCTCSFYVKNPKGKKDHKSHTFFLPILKQLGQYRDYQRQYISIERLLIVYNGIVLPNHSNFTRGNFNKYQIKLGGDLSLGFIILNDHLKPTLSIARDGIKTMPWNFYSQVNFIINLKFKKPSSINEEIDYFESIDLFSIDTSNEVLQKDQLLIDKKYWYNLLDFDADETIVDNRYSRRASSLVQLLRKGDYSLSTMLKRKLLQNFKELEIELSFVKLGSGIRELLYLGTFLDKPHIENNKSGRSIFCKYKNYSGLTPSNLRHDLYNEDHVFSKWLIKVFLFLNSNYRYYLDTILRADNIETINNILTKLKIMLPEEMRPDFVLTEADVGVNFDELEEWVPEEDEDRLGDDE